MARIAARVALRLKAIIAPINSFAFLLCTMNSRESSCMKKIKFNNFLKLQVYILVDLF